MATLALNRAGRRALSTAATGAAAAARARASPAAPRQLVVLEYTYAPSTMEALVAARAPHRPAHLAHAEAWRAAGKLALGGAFGDAPPGGLLVFQGCTREEVASFAAADPYVTSGLVKAWTARPWTVVVEAD